MAHQILDGHRGMGMLGSMIRKIIYGAMRSSMEELLKAPLLKIECNISRIEGDLREVKADIGEVKKDIRDLKDDLRDIRSELRDVRVEQRETTKTVNAALRLR